MIPPQLPGSPSYLRPGTPALAKFLLRSRLHHRRVRQEPPGRSHRGAADGARLPGILGLPLSPRRDAAGELPRHQQDRRPCRASRRRARTRRSPACPRSPAPSIPKTTRLPDAAAPGALVQILRRHGEEPDVQRRGSADAGALEDGGRGDLGQGHRLPRPQRSEEDQQAVLRLVQPGAHARRDRAVAEVRGHAGRARRQGLGRQRSRHEADGRQHRRRAQEARGHGPARQHHRRLHHRQRRRGDLLPRRRRHAVQGPEGRGLGRRLPRPDGRPLAGPHQAGHGARTSCSPRSTGCRPWSTSPAGPRATG